MTSPTLRQTNDPANTGIVVLTFNRPEAHNALTIETMIAFSEAVCSLAAQDDLRAVVLTGAGEKAFCSGADIAEMATLTSEADAVDMTTRMGEALLTLERLSVPVIAAVNGHALGGGAEIAIACDLRIVDSGARLGFVQIRRGLIPGWGGGQRLLRQVGYGRAFDILMRGKVLNADELMSLGLATEIAAPGEALTGAMQLARDIATHDPDAVRAMKALLQAGQTQSYDHALRTERALFPPLWAGETRLSSMRSFLQEKGTRG